MKPLQLQVGKSYKNRKGEIETIVKNDGERNYPFLSDKGGDFTLTGRYNVFEELDKDLIEEVTELNTKPMKPTDEQIKEKAEKYTNEIFETRIFHYPNDDHQKAIYASNLIYFAKTLFQETEEETWHRICQCEKATIEHAKLFHQERKRIENG